MTAPKSPATGSTPPTGTASSPATPATPRPASGNNANWDQDEEPWRHPPVAPKDESPLDSFGRAVSDVVTGSDTKPAKPKP